MKLKLEKINESSPMKANAYLTLSQLHMMEYFVKEVKDF